MKKLLIITMITITILSLTKKEVIKIPNESIRFRIVASSNNQKDQQIKKELLKKLTNSINEIEIIPNNIEETRKNKKAQSIARVRKEDKSVDFTTTYDYKSPVNLS